MNRWVKRNRARTWRGIGQRAVRIFESSSNPQEPHLLGHCRLMFQDYRIIEVSDTEPAVDLAAQASKLKGT